MCVCVLSLALPASDGARVSVGALQVCVCVALPCLLQTGHVYLWERCFLRVLSLACFRRGACICRSAAGVVAAQMLRAIASPSRCVYVPCLRVSVGALLVLWLLCCVQLPAPAGVYVLPCLACFRRGACTCGSAASCVC